MAKAQAINGLDSQAPTAQNARTIVHARLAEMYAYAAYIESPDHIQELHDLRIAAKRVRYTLEVFAEFLPEASQGFAEELATLQDELGALHDSEVMLALLRLLLQQEQTAPAVSNGQTRRTSKQKAFLSPELVQTLLDAEQTSAPTENDRHGLRRFLHRQEQRRLQAYTSFRQHWEELEQRHFRAEIVQMLDGGKAGEESVRADRSRDEMKS